MLSFKKIITLSCLVTFMGVQAQSYHLSTRIVSTSGEKLNNAVGTITGENSVKVNDDGILGLDIKKDRTVLTVICPGYFPVRIPVEKGSVPERITLIPEDWAKYENLGGVVDKKDMQQSLDLDHALQGQVSGLEVIRKSGMPGEGSSLNIRGLHSLVAENTPLVLINGAPLLSDLNMSNVIRGYSRGLFNAINLKDIRKVTVLKGADAAQYGSLGNNGVISIETEQAQSNILETRISFSGQYGMNFGTRKLPMLSGEQYKNYLRNVGMTRYDQATPLYADYPFLQSDASYPRSYLYGYDTDWQDYIYNNGLATNNVFRVEGGDAIAKYNLSVGYTSNGGTLGSTKTDRYSTLLNSNIMVTRKLDIFTTLGLSFLSSQLQEQGLYHETNPLLAACYSNPLLSSYKPDKDGALTKDYATYDLANYNETPTFAYENTSNPLAMVNTIEMSDKIYDVNLQIGLKYRFNPYWTAQGYYNVFYRYTEENTFIPGVTSRAILPQYYGLGLNTVRRGTNQYHTNYVDLSASYSQSFDEDNDLKANFGARYLSNTMESDMASGYNTANDYYKTLQYTTDEGYIDGYNNEWIWNNFYGTADYTYKNLLKYTGTLSLDGSSVSGKDAPRYYVYPAGKVTLLGNGLQALPSWIDKLNCSIGYGLTGNSRFSSNYGKNYYTSTNYFMMSSIIRSNVPNTKIEPEKSRQFDLGADVALFGDKVLLSAGYYHAYAYDLLVAENISAVYASSSYYNNTAAVSSQGVELSARLTPVETKDFSWTVGGTITTDKSIVKSLGNEQDEMTISFKQFNGDDAKVKLVVGESPYQFFGYKTKGIYSTSDEVAADGYTNVYGGSYTAGDVRFVNSNSTDKVINEKDKVLLGKATPDCFGSFYTAFRYKDFTLSADFNYSIGNKAYNGLRRKLESMGNLYNQSEAVLNRWQVEGQQTSMPRAAYGDPSGNNLFSDRWIEDASYLRLSALTLNYSIDNPFLGLFRSADVWLTGENLLTVTNYLGIDPEFAYSYEPSLRGFDYGKAGQYRTVKLGFTLNF